RAGRHHGKGARRAPGAPCGPVRRHPGGNAPEILRRRGRPADGSGKKIPVTAPFACHPFLVHYTESFRLLSKSASAAPRPDVRLPVCKKKPRPFGTRIFCDRSFRPACDRPAAPAAQPATMLTNLPFTAITLRIVQRSE